MITSGIFCADSRGLRGDGFTDPEPRTFGPHSCAQQLAARQSQNIAGDGVLCTGMDCSSKREKVDCCLVVGLPTPPVLDGAESTTWRDQAHRARTKTLDDVTRSRMLFRQTQLGTTLKGHVVALESNNLSAAR